MSPPPIQLYLTTIALNPVVRQRQDYILRVLQVKKIAFTSYDLASDEDAKKLWRRKAPRNQQQPPGILIGGEYAGTFDEFEEAVESETIDQFLRLKESWSALEGDKPPPEVKPIGVAGAYSPLQMNPKHRPTPSPGPSPMKTNDNSRGRQIDAGEELGGYGLEGVTVSEQDLMDLMAELMGEEDAKDLLGVKKDKGKTPETEERETKLQIPAQDKEKVIESKDNKPAETPTETKGIPLVPEVIGTEDKADGNVKESDEPKTSGTETSESEKKPSTTEVETTP